MKTLLAISLGIVLVLPSGAQETANGVSIAAPPPAISVAAVPAYGAWTVSVDKAKPSAAPATPAPPAAPQGRQVKEISSTKTDAIKRDIITYTDGSTEEIWFVDKCGFFPSSYDKTKVMIYDLSGGNGAMGERGNPTQSFGFSGVEWVNKRYFDQAVSFQGVRCYHYKLTTAGGAEAWIAVDTGLPVAYQMDGLLYTYKHETAPTTPLVLPPAQQEQYDKYRRLQTRRRQLDRDFNLKSAAR